MKYLMSIVLVLTLATSLTAKTDIFGDERNASILYDDNNVLLDFGFTPIERLDWGVRVQGQLDEAVSDEHLKWDDTLLGLWAHFPAVGFDSLINKLPLSGEVFAGCSLLYDVGTNTDLLFMAELGADIAITDNIDGRVMVQYGKRDTVLDEETRLMAGIVVRWE